MNTTLHPCRLFNVILLSTCLISGCATEDTKLETDHWEGFNRSMLAFNDDVDNLILKPTATAYLWSTPEFIDTGITNFFNNLDDIGVAINDVLQCKWLQGGQDFGRFLLNTSVGVAGFVDVGTLLDLQRHDEDFDQTLAVWGVPAGNYLVLPFVGSSSTRGVFGLLGDTILHPLSYTFLLGGGIVSVASISSSAVDVTDRRAGLLSTEKIINEAAAVDRYDFLKNTYWQRRNYLIHDGQVPDSDIDDAISDSIITPPTKSTK